MSAAANDNAETEPTDEAEAGKDAGIEAKAGEVVKADEASLAKEKEEIAKRFKPAYSFFVLFIVLMCRIMVQWHRKGLTYAYGYTALGELAGSKVYEISSFYPELK